MKPQSGTVSTGLTHLLPANRSRYTATWPLTKVRAQSNKFQGRWFKPHLQVSGYFFNPQLFLFGYGFRPHGVPDESGIQIRNFLNPISRVEIFEYAMNPDSCSPLIRIFFLSRGVIRSSNPVFYREYCSHVLTRLYDACSAASNRVNPDTCWIRVGVEIFESGEKKLRIQNYAGTCWRGLSFTLAAAA